MQDFSLVGVGSLSVDKDYVLSASDLSAIVTRDDISGFVTEDQLGGFATRDELSDYALSSSLSSYLSKIDGGSISGNVQIFQKDLNVLSGRFSGGTDVYTDGTDSFAYGNLVSAIGDNSYAVGANSIAGCYGWYYSSIDFTTKQIYLSQSTEQPTMRPTSGAGEVIQGFQTNLAVDDVISYVNKAKYDLKSKIVAIDNNVLSVDILGSSAIDQSESPSEWKHDDWTIFCPDKPLAGIVWLGYTSYVEGENNKAINAYSHAEGKDNVAYGQYAHVEGRNNTAGYASHAEGKSTNVSGQYAHGEGISCTASGNYSHAEGYQTKAAGESAHAEGRNASAYGQFSHAEGNSTNAIGKNSHAEGLGNKEALTPNITCEAGTMTYTIDSSHGILTGMFIWYNKIFAKVTNVAIVDSSTVDITVDKSLNPKEALDNATFYKVLYYASGDYAHSEGYYTKSTGVASHSEGGLANAATDYAHAEGYNTIACGIPSHAEGEGTTASGNHSHAEGLRTTASSYRAHAEGADTIASNEDAHAEGICTTASGKHSHAEGNISKARNQDAHAEGYNTYADGVASHAEGEKAKSFGDNSHAEGKVTTSIGINSHAEGEGLRPSSTFTFSGEANATTYTTNVAHGLVMNSIVNYGSVFAKIIAVPTTTSFTVNVTLSKNDAISGKQLTLVSGSAFGQASHTEGHNNSAIGTYSHAEGNETKACSSQSHSEGWKTNSYGTASHAEGYNTVAGDSERLIPDSNETLGNYTHAEGNGTLAKGNASHAEGAGAQAVGLRSHAEGSYTITSNKAEHAEGQCNRSNKASDTFGNAGNTLHSVGIGSSSSDANRANAFEIMQNGDVYILGVGGYNGKNIAEAQTLQQVISSLVSRIA